MYDTLPAVARGATWTTTLEITDGTTGTLVPSADLSGASYKVDLFLPDALTLSYMTIADVAVAGDGLLQWSALLPSTLRPGTYQARIRATIGSRIVDLKTLLLPVLP